MDKYDELQEWWFKSSEHSTAVSMASTFVFWFGTARPSWRRHYDPLQHQKLTQWHSVTSQETWCFCDIAARTSDLLTEWSGHRRAQNSNQDPSVFRLIIKLDTLTLILRCSRTGTVWFYNSTSNKRAARPKLYTKSLTRDLKLMYSRFTLVRISINL